MKVVVVDAVEPFRPSPLDLQAERLVAAFGSAGHDAELLRVPLLSDSPARLRGSSSALSLMGVEGADLAVALRLPAPLLRAEASVWWTWGLLGQLASAPGTSEEVLDLLGPAAGSLVWASSVAAHRALAATGRRSLLLPVPLPDPDDVRDVGDVVVDLAGMPDETVTAVFAAAARPEAPPVLIEDRSVPAAAVAAWRRRTGAAQLRWSSDTYADEPVAGIAAVVAGTGDVEGSAAAAAGVRDRPVLSGSPTSVADALDLLRRAAACPAHQHDGAARSAPSAGQSWADVVQRLCTTVTAVTRA